MPWSSSTSKLGLATRPPGVFWGLYLYLDTVYLYVAGSAPDSTNLLPVIQQSYDSFYRTQRSRCHVVGRGLRARWLLAKTVNVGCFNYLEHLKHHPQTHTHTPARPPTPKGETRLEPYDRKQQASRLIRLHIYVQPPHSPSRPIQKGKEKRKKEKKGKGKAAEVKKSQLHSLSSI